MGIDNKMEMKCAEYHLFFEEEMIPNMLVSVLLFFSHSLVSQI